MEILKHSCNHSSFFFPAEQQLCSMSVSDDWHLGVYYRLSFRETKPVAVAGL